MPMKRFQCGAQIKSTSDETGIIEAIVSVTGNTDRGGERIMPGFFTKSLMGKKPRGVWAHDWAKPIAKTLAAEEWAVGDQRLPEPLRPYGGYYIKAQFNLETQRGKEAYSDLKFGTIDEFSIGFIVTKEMDNKTNRTRDLIEGEWLEWSPVLVGMNPATQMISIKDASQVGAELKGYLGSYIESSMTMGAVYRLFDRMLYCAIDYIYNEDISHEERMTAINGALGEFSFYFSKVVDAIMSGAGQDPAMAANEVQLYSTSDDTEIPLEGLRYVQHSQRALDVAKKWLQRTETIVAIREARPEAKAGRVLSEANRTMLAEAAQELSAIASRIQDLVDATDPNNKGMEAKLLDAKILYSSALLSVARNHARGV